MASKRSTFRRVLSHVTAFAIALGPFAVSLHAVHHLTHSSPASYSAHDESAHHAHSAPDHHHLCGLCVHAKAPYLSAAPAPEALAATASQQARVSSAERALPSVLIATAAPRAPPAIG